MAFAEDVGGAGLGAGLAQLLREADLGADLEPVEIAGEHAVAMEIDVALVGGLDEAIALFGEEPDDPAGRRRLMRLDRAVAWSDP